MTFHAQLLYSYPSECTTPLLNVILCILSKIPIECIAEMFS